MHLATNTAVRMTRDATFNMMGKAEEQGAKALMSMFDDGEEQDERNEKNYCFVHVQVVSCTGITLPEGAEQLDLFGSVSDGNKRFLTATHEKTLEAKFNESCTFYPGTYKDILDCKMEIQVRDANFLARGAVDDVLGEGSISFFEEAKPGTHFTKTVELFENSMLEDMLESSILGRAAADLAENLGADVDKKKTGATVTLDIYIGGADLNSELSSLRLIAAANVLKRPIFLHTNEEEEYKHGLGYFGSTGLFPPLRLKSGKYFKSPIPLAWRDPGW
jgi:hypothetical protein